jgi:hypothetical protein
MAVSSSDMLGAFQPSAFSQTFLSRAKISQGDIPKYAAFLEDWGLKEGCLEYLTREVIEQHVVVFQKKYSTFEIRPAEVIAIADTAKHWGNLGTFFIQVWITLHLLASTSSFNFH